MPDRSCKQFWSAEKPSALHRHYSALNTCSDASSFSFCLKWKGMMAISADGFIARKFSRSMRNREFVRQPHHQVHTFSERRCRNSLVIAVHALDVVVCQGERHKAICLHVVEPELS